MKHKLEARRLKARATQTKSAYADSPIPYINENAKSPQGDFVCVARAFSRRAIYAGAYVDYFAKSHLGRTVGNNKRQTTYLIILMLLSACLSAFAPYNVEAAPPEGFASTHIRAVWQRDDGPVASGRVSRTWMWGPGPFYTNYEPYKEAQEGNHLVQYFDKGRLEINHAAGDPSSPWYVTSGLLVKEMVSGKAQNGDDSLYALGPANIPVAGDASTTSPTYATFAKLTARTTNQTGKPIEAVADIHGQIINQPPPTPAIYGSFEEASGHNWADVFWNFANNPQRPAAFNWLPTLGYPITEPYWVRTIVSGKPQTVLVQLFERRTLTYNPSNPPTTQVEMGNVGLHYYNWRYAHLHHANFDAKYNVKIKVGPKPTRATHVEQTLEFTNNTGQTLQSAILHAVWRHWDGAFTLQQAKVGGQTAQTRWRQGINLEVTLPKPLPNGERTTIALTFDLKPRPVGGRTGYDRANDILCLGDMLPTLVPWENGGWAYYPYSDLGDFGFYDASDYTVEAASTGNERQDPLG